jgi:hypothetical protein
MGQGLKDEKFFASGFALKAKSFWPLDLFPRPLAAAGKVRVSLPAAALVAVRINTIRKAKGEKWHNKKQAVACYPLGLRFCVLNGLRLVRYGLEGKRSGTYGM